MPRELHPDARLMLDRLDEANAPPLHTLSIDGARKLLLELSDTDPEPYANERTRDLSIASEDAEISVRVYDPGGDGPLPILFYLHGGGWSLGSLDSVDALCRLLATEAGCLVVSMDYPLAPEHRFPVQIRDSYTALEWLAENGEHLGGDLGRIAVGGDSAGGNLATVLALLSDERDGPEIAYQLLIYPVTNYAFDTDSYLENGEGYYLHRRDMQRFWNFYLGDPIHGANPYASPLRCPDLSGLPPAYVLTCEFDPLRDEGRAYANRLREHGVSVTHETERGMIHGFFRHVTRVPRAKAAAIQAAETLHEKLST